MDLNKILRKLPSEKPSFIAPMQCKLVPELPEGDQWLYELKFDGYRALGIKDGKHAEIISRNEKNLSKAYPEIMESLNGLSHAELIFDGEIVAVDEKGFPSFQLLQASAPYKRNLLFYVFDVLHYKGKNLRGLPLIERKEILQSLLPKDDLIRLSQTLNGQPSAIMEQIRKFSLEGAVAKMKSAHYEAGLRTGSWIKVKSENEDDFVIGGYRSSGRRNDFDVILVGYYRERKFHYAAKVKAGFTPYLKKQVAAALSGLETTRMPFVDVPRSSGGRWGEGLTEVDLEQCVWVKPKMKCRVKFVEWTHAGHLRHPKFVGLVE